MLATDFSRQAPYQGTDLAASTYTMLHDALIRWSYLGLVKRKDSFGYAVASLDPQVRQGRWNNLENLIWFVGGWGPERDKYVMNAVRKIRAAARESTDTLDIVRYNPELFRDVDKPDGDFPWGGAKHMGRQLASVSALSQEEDHWVAGIIGGFLDLAMYKQDQLASHVG